MVDVLFFLGVVTCIGCGANVMLSQNKDWKIELVWILGGAIGAAIIAASIYMNNM